VDGVSFVPKLEAAPVERDVQSGDRIDQNSGVFDNVFLRAP